MHALIVVAHSDPNSLTHAVAGQIARTVASSGAGHSVEIADLAAEGFDPRFTADDLAVFRSGSPAAADIAAEQGRIDRANALVLVYPVYWWSMPALLKGWIDRVFIHGWAFEDRPAGTLVKKLGHLPVHLVAIAGADMRTYARHGYFGAMKTQIDHGIFGYCGAPVMTSELLLPQPDREAHMRAASLIGARVFEASGR